ncbi:MAG: 4-hydroxy-3-methylbut-2-enyl diphosphate reductase [Pseudomonadota bacterium]
MEILLASPRGFCAGVDRAIEIVNRALDLFGAPIYVRHEVVHNRYVVSELQKKGAIFVEEIQEIPENATAIFSAHGVSQKVRQDAKERGLKVFDATCPLVTKVHMEVAKISKKNEECILIGHKGHPEVEGTMGQYDSMASKIYLVEDLEDVAALRVENPKRLHFVTQTTLSVDDTRSIIDALQRRFPHIQGPKKDDICYATQNRQDAVKELAQICSLVLVVGSKNSSNSNRLRELAEKMGAKSYLIDDASQIQKAWLSGIDKVGVTAGASAPEILVEEVVSALEVQGGKVINNTNGVEETITFALPSELR